MAGPVDELPAYQLARRQKILDAARHLLESKDYEQIQIRDVAAEAGVALGTLYRYFSSKEHLYAAVIFDWGAPFARISASWKPETTAAERLRMRIHGALDAFEKRPQFYKAMTILRTRADENALALMASFGEMLEAPLREDLSGLPEDEARDITVMVWSILMDLVNRMITGYASMADASRVADLFIEMVAERIEAGKRR